MLVVCLPAGRPGSHVLVPLALRSRQPRVPTLYTSIVFYVFSFKLCGVLPANNVFRLAFLRAARAPCLVSCVLFLLFPSAHWFFLSEASKPHYEVWGKIYHLISVLNSRIFDLSSRFWDDMVIIFYRRVICIYDYVFRVG